MRKIKSQDQLNKEKARNVRIMSFFMLIILIFGTIGFGFSGLGGGDNSGDGNSQQNSFDGNKTLKINGEDIMLQNSLNDVKGINMVLFKTINDYANKPVYIDSENQDVFLEIQKSLGKFALSVQEACYENCDENKVKKDCSENLVVWKESPENLIYQQDNCVFIEGDLKAVDAFIYKSFGLGN